MKIIMKNLVVFTLLALHQGVCFGEDVALNKTQVLINKNNSLSFDVNNHTHPDIPVTEINPPTVTPSHNTTTTPKPVPTTITTTLAPTTTKGTTQAPTTSTTPKNNGSTTPAPSPSSTSTTTPLISSTTPSPHNNNKRFDGPSFVGGIVLALGMVAIAFVAYKFFKQRSPNYHTL